VAVKKSSTPRGLPPVHPGLAQKIRDAETAEIKGESPPRINDSQKILRQSFETYSKLQKQQAYTLGLLDPAYVEKDAPKAFAEQIPFKPGVDLDNIWDELSEQEKLRAGAIERFRLEMDNMLARLNKNKHLPHQIGGRIDARNLKRLQENLFAYIEGFADFLAPDSRNLLERFVLEMRDLLGLCIRVQVVRGIDAICVKKVFDDLTQKMLYQEFVSRFRGMGDRGIRKIAGAIDVAEKVFSQMARAPNFAPRNRLLMRILLVHQDLGYTAYAARGSYRGGQMARIYGARIFTDELDRYRALLTADEIELARIAVASHNSEEFPFANQFFVALLRCVTHLTPFYPHLIVKHLQTLPDAHIYLDDLLARAKSQDIVGYGAAKDAFAVFLKTTTWPQPLQEDILAGFRAFAKGASFVDLCNFAGVVQLMRLEPSEFGLLRVTLQNSQWLQKYQALFDSRQELLVRSLRRTGVNDEVLQQAPVLEVAKVGMGTLAIVQGSTESTVTEHER